LAVLVSGNSEALTTARAVSHIKLHFPTRDLNLTFRHPFADETLFERGANKDAETVTAQLQR
jgi:hypothetical protein